MAMTAPPGTSADNEGERGPVTVGIDGSDKSKEALAWAARWAALSGDDLVAVIVWHFPTSWGWSPPWPPEYNPRAEAESVLKETLAEVLGPSASVITKVLEGQPAPVLVDQSKGSSLVVVGCRGHGEFAGMLLGSVSEFLAGHAHCPVVIVRDGQEALDT
jgi:nucleotide-binding universal stress UspA family protein